MKSSNIIHESTEPAARINRPCRPHHIVATLALKARSLVSAALVATFFSVNAPAHAANYYYSAVLRNNTNITISYYVRVNNSPVVLHTLRPGQFRTYYWLNPRVPISVFVYYDRRLADNKITWASDRLNMWGCGAPAQGWPQGFIRVNDGYDLVISK